jgi:hypothetical protein
MGVPEWHYKRALQNLAHGLAYDESPKKAKQLNEETSEEVLKQFIFEKKAEISEQEFYYMAGRAAQCTIDEAYAMGTDSFNAAAGGIGLFEELIGIENIEEDPHG